MDYSEPEDRNDVEDAEDKKAFLFDWASEQLPRRTTFMLFAIDFTLATPTDRVQLRIPKHDSKTQFVYVAGFFVKEGTNWYIYRKALIVNRHRTSDELPAIFRELERTGYSQLQWTRRRTLHPLEYISITL